MTLLHHIGEWLREALQAAPLSAVKVLFLLIPASLLVWILTLPKEEVVPTENPTLASNLRIWAGLALSIQLLIYLWF